MGAGLVVEFGDGVVVVGDEQPRSDVTRELDVPVPIRHGPGDGVVSGLSDEEPAPLPIRVDRLIDGSVSKLGEGVTFPLLALTDVRSEFRDRESVGERSEQAAGTDLGQLAIVTDQDQLPGRRLDEVSNGRELTGADHPRLVDHHDRTVGKAASVSALPDQPGQGHRRDPGGGVETGGGPTGECPAEDGATGEHGELPNDVHDSGLAGPCRADPDVDGVARSGKPSHHGGLFVGEVRAASQPGFDQNARCGPPSGTDAGNRVFDDPLLSPQQFGRAVAPFVTGTGEETRVPTSHHPSILLDASVPQPVAGSVEDDVGVIRHSGGAGRVEATRLNRRSSSRARDQSLLNSLILRLRRTNARRGRADGRPPLGRRPRQRGYAPATISKAFQIVSRAFRVAVTDGIITRSPCREVKLPKIETPERRFLSPGEVEELADTIEARYRALVLTGAYTGLRFGELAALRIDDFDPLRRTLRVDEQLSRQGTGRMVSSPLKTRKARRTIGIPQFVVDKLVTQLSTYPSSSDLIFSMPRGGPLDYNRFRSRYWNPAVDASVSSPCTPHDLRHTHVALLIAQGESPKYVADRLGHESTRTYSTSTATSTTGSTKPPPTVSNRPETFHADQARTKRGPEVIELPTSKPKSLAT